MTVLLMAAYPFAKLTVLRILVSLRFIRKMQEHRLQEILVYAMLMEVISRSLIMTIVGYPRLLYSRCSMF